MPSEHEQPVAENTRGKGADSGVWGCGVAILCSSDFRTNPPPPPPREDSPAGEEEPSREAVCGGGLLLS